MPETWVVNTATVYSLRISEARSLNQGVGSGELPFDVLEEKPFLASSTFLLVSGHTTVNSASVVTWSLPPFCVSVSELLLPLSVHMMAFRLHLDNPG